MSSLMLWVAECMRVIAELDTEASLSNCLYSMWCLAEEERILWACFMGIASLFLRYSSKPA